MFGINERKFASMRKEVVRAGGGGGGEWRRGRRWLAMGLLATGVDGVATDRPITDNR